MELGRELVVFAVVLGALFLLYVYAQRRMKEAERRRRSRREDGGNKEPLLGVFEMSISKSGVEGFVGWLEKLWAEE